MIRNPNQFSGMPQMGDAFSDWMQPVTFDKRIQTVVDGLVYTDDKPISFNGTIQPLSPKAIALKPEGQRAWPWLQIHCFHSKLDITTNDVIIYNCTAYKVMGVLDYSLNGYVEYHLVQDYKL